MTHGVSIRVCHACGRDTAPCSGCGTEVEILRFDQGTERWLCSNCFEWAEVSWCS